MPGLAPTALEVARRLLDAVAQGLTERGEQVPDRRYVNAGEVPWDCEQLAVQLVRVFPGRPGAEQRGLSPCTGPRSVELMLTLLRCVPVADGDQPLALSAADGAGANVTDGAWALWQTLAGLAGERTPLGQSAAVGPLRVEGPEAGMVGMTATVQVGL